MSRTALLLTMATLFVTGCDGDGADGPTGEPPALDGGSNDGGPMLAPDPGPDWDCDVTGEPGELLGDLGAPMVMVRGAIRGAALPVAEAGDPEPGALRGPDSQLAGARVTLLGPDGSAISRGTTDCDGRYVLPAPAATMVFIQIDPVDGPGGGYPGFIEARYVGDADLEQWDMWLLRTHELSWRLGMLGREYDRDTGWIVQSFASPRTPGGGLRGGEGVEVTGTAAGPGFVVTATRTIETNRLPAECGEDDASGIEPGEPVVEDGEIVCYTDLLEMIFIPAVTPTAGAEIQLVDPPHLRCAQREEVPRWVVQPNTVSRLRADCR